MRPQHRARVVEALRMRTSVFVALAWPTKQPSFSQVRSMQQRRDRVGAASVCVAAWHLACILHPAHNLAAQHPA